MNRARLILAIIISITSQGAFASNTGKAKIVKALDEKSTSVETIQIDGRSYATYIGDATFSLMSPIWNISSVLIPNFILNSMSCKTAKALAKQEAFDLCHKLGGKDCRMSLIVTDPAEHRGAEDVDMNICRAAAYAVDLSHPTDEKSPVSAKSVVFRKRRR